MSDYFTGEDASSTEWSGSFPEEETMNDETLIKTAKIDSGWGLWRVQTLSGGEDVVYGNLIHLLEEGLVQVKRGNGDTALLVNSGAFESALLLPEEDNGDSE